METAQKAGAPIPGSFPGTAWSSITAESSPGVPRHRQDGAGDPSSTEQAQHITKPRPSAFRQNTACAPKHCSETLPPKNIIK